MRSRIGLVLSLLVVLVAVAPGCDLLRPSEVRTISADELTKLTLQPDPPLVLDARSPEEYAAGHVPGAINVPFRDVGSRLPELEPYRTRGVVTYCEHGSRSALAQRTLSEAGFRKLMQLEGDMAGWRASGRPIETKAP